MAVADPIGQATPKTFLRQARAWFRIREDLWVGFGCFFFLQIYRRREEMWLLVVKKEQPSRRGQIISDQH